MIEDIGRSLYVSAGLFWKAFWALAFGYAFSSLIQVLVPREIIARHPGRNGAKPTIPSLRINATYYGWRFAAYLGFVFTVSAVGAGIAIHALFSVLGLIPEPTAGRVQEMARFRIDYVFFLNLAAIVLTGVLIWLASHRAEEIEERSSDARDARRKHA